MRHTLRITICFILCIISCVGSLCAQTIADDTMQWWNTDYNTTEGTDFYLTFMDNYGKHVQDEDLSLSIYATARQNAIVTVTGIFTDPVSHNSTSWSKQFTVHANSIDSIFIPNEVAYLQESNQTTNFEWLNKGIHVTSTAPISLYSHNANVNSYDASLILPVEGLYKEYVIQTYSTDIQSTEFAIVSTSDYNEITVNLRETSGGNITITQLTFTLNRGQTYCYRPINRNISLAGTTICASEPIAVFQGGQHAQIPQNESGPSHIYHQAFSTDYWGKSYFVTRTKGMNADVVRITAAQDNTQILKNGTLVATINRLETYEDMVQWHGNTQAVHYQTSLATTCYLYHSKRGVSFGAPALTPIVPTEQGIKSIILATFHETRVNELGLPANAQDTLNKYYKHYVNIVTPTSAVSGMRLDNNSIASQFTPISGTNYSCAIVDISDATHLLTNNSGEFTSRVYGVYHYTGEDYNYEANISYAYSGGSNCLHSAHMLIDGQRINQKNICRNTPVNLRSVVNYDFTDLNWELENTTLGYTLNRTEDNLPGLLFPDTGRWEVRMIVDRTTPVCQYNIRDIVRATIIVSDTFHIQPSAAKGTYRIICEGDRSDTLVRGKTYQYRADTMRVNKTYNFVDSLKTVADCDSIVHIRVFIAPEYEVNTSATTCSDKLPYTWRPRDKTNNDYTTIINPDNIDHYPYVVNTQQTLQTRHGCDSIVHLRLTIHDVPRDTTNLTLCSTELPYTWHVHGRDSIIKQPGTYSDTIPNAQCYDISVLQLNVNQAYYDSTYVNVCDGNGFSWTQNTAQYQPNANWTDTLINTPGIYRRTLTTAEGCTDVRVLNISFEPSTTTRDTVRITQDQLPYTDWKPKDNEGEHPHTIDIDGWTNTVFSDYRSPIDSLMSITLKNSHGCDSIVQRLLIIYPNYQQDTAAVICEGERVWWEKTWWQGQQTERDADHGADFFGQTQYSDTVITIRHEALGGADSIRTLHLTVNPREFTKYTPAGCEPFTYTFNGVTKTYTAADNGDKVYYDTIRSTTEHGCEKIEVLELTAYKVYHFEEQVTISDKEPFDWHGEHHDHLDFGQYDFYYNKTTIHGCDSTYHIHVTVQQAYNFTTAASICQNEEYTWLKHHNDTLFRDLEPGSYTVYDSLTTHQGQDSVHVLQLTVNPTYELTLPQVKLCQDIASYDWRRADNGQLIRQITLPQGVNYPYQETFTDTLRTIHGCDSVLHLPVIIYPTYDMPVMKVTLCETEMPYMWVLRDGNVTNVIHDKTIALPDNAFTADNNGVLQPWNYQDTYTLKTINGCDSTVHISLTVKPVLRTAVNRTICPEQLPYTIGTTQLVFSQAGTQTETLTSNLYGCDSVVTYHIDVMDKIEQHIDTFVCRADLPYNHPTLNNNLHNLLQSGTFRDTLTAVSGCDSIIILNLDIHEATALDTTIYLCRGDFYHDPNNGNDYYQDITYVETITNAALCDSVITTHIIVGETYETTEDSTFCETDMPITLHFYDSHSREDVVIPRRDLLEQPLDTTITRTLHTNFTLQCDSVVSKHIIIKPITHNRQDLTWCASAGEYHYGENGKTAFETGIYIDTLQTPNHYGCDSVLILNLTLLDSIIVHTSVEVCENQLPYNHPTLTHNFLNLTLGGDYRDTLQSASLCDSLVILHFTVNPVPHTYLTDSTCRGDEYYYPNHNNGIGGYLPADHVGTYTYIDTLRSVHDCDSIITLTFHVYPTYEFYQDIHVCQDTVNTLWQWIDEQGGSHGFYDISQPGEYTYGDSLTTIHGCDSIYGIRLVVDPIYAYHETISMCESDTLRWHGRLYVGSKFYNYGSYDITQYDGVYTYGAGTYQEKKVYRTNHGCHTCNHCDSTYYLQLVIYPTYITPADTTYADICDNETYRFTTLTLDTLCNAAGEWISDNHTDGRYLLTGWDKTINGCDSAVAHVITVHPTYEFYQTIKVCQDTVNTLWEWIDEQGGSHDFYDISQPGDYVYNDHQYSRFGCDSIFGVKLHVPPIYRFDSTYTICQNESFTWQGRTYAGDSTTYQSGNIIRAVGNYADTVRYTTHEGCDSIFYMQYTIHPIYNIYTEQSSCANEDFVWIQSDIHGTYRDTLWTSDMQDTVHLDTYQALTQVQQLKPTQTVYHERMLATIHGCDSMSRTLLTVHPSYLFRTDTTVCAREPVNYRGKTFRLSRDTIYNERLSAAGGCDSIYQLHVHVKPTYIYNIYDSICDNQTYYFAEGGNVVVWGPGNPKPHINDHIDLQYNTSEGCDSIFRFYLTVLPTYTFADTTFICSSDSIVPVSGHNYEFPDSYYPVGTAIEPYDTLLTDSYQTIYGCDSTYSVLTTVCPAYLHTDFDTICDNGTLHWREHLYHDLRAGNYYFADTLVSMHGCDSIYELNLTVYPTYFYELHETICDDEFYDFHGRQLNVQNFYTDSLISQHGCDSVYHLYLTVLPTTEETRYDTICVSETYYLPHYELTERGYYRDTTINQYGCRHFINLYLEVIPPTTMQAHVDTICANERNLYIYYSYQGHHPIEYSVLFDDFGHSQGFEDVIHAPVLFGNDSIIEIPVPRDDEDRTVFPRPDIYPITVFLHNGICRSDSSCMDHVNALLQYPSWIHEQHWNDAIVLFNEKYNGGYVWDAYQWYENGVPLIGQTKEYLYMPHFLTFGAEYTVELTRVDDNKTFFTCPIIPVMMTDTVVPVLPYFSVVPTLMVKEKPEFNILSTISGHYELVDVSRATIIKSGRFEPDEHHAMWVEIPGIQAGIYIVRLWADNGESRVTKIIVR